MDRIELKLWLTPNTARKTSKNLAKNTEHSICILFAQELGAGPNFVVIEVGAIIAIRIPIRQSFAANLKRKDIGEDVTNIYVGNLSPEVTQENLRQLFATFGQVTRVTVLKGRFPGESRGFGFVEMPIKVEAQAAIVGLNGRELKGRSLIVDAARPRTDERRGSLWRGGGLRGGRRPF